MPLKCRPPLPTSYGPALKQGTLFGTQCMPTKVQLMAPLHERVDKFLVMKQCLATGRWIFHGTGRSIMFYI